MKKLLIALAAVLVTAASYAQGTVNFVNRVSGGVDAPITFNGTGPGPNFSAALYMGGTMVPDSTTTFRSGAGAAYLVSKVVTIPGVPGGSPATLQIRAWETAAGSYEAASTSTTFAFGESADFTVTLAAPPNTPADLPASVQGFTLRVVPEPSTIALGVLGAAALLLRRRK